MSLLADYHTARRDEDVARLRRALALRALVAGGTSQREIATALGVSQPAVSRLVVADATARMASISVPCIIPSRSTWV